MKKNTLRLGALGIAAALTGGLFSAGVADAATIGALQLVGGTTATNVNTPWNVQAQSACPASTTNILGYINGPGGWVNIPAFSNTEIQQIDITQNVPVANTLGNLAQSNGITVVDGNYTIQLLCSNDLFGLDIAGDFTGTFSVSGSSVTWAAFPSTAVATTTTVSAPGTAQVGNNVNLTATVAPAAATGTVQFKDGTTNLGAPVTVSGGTASLTTSFATVGTKSITAVFTPADSNAYQASTSTAATVVVSAGPAATTLSLSVPATLTEADTIPLSATVSPRVAGTVTFTEGGNPVGTAAVNTSNGIAFLSLPARAAGSYTFAASFAPADTAVAQPSTATAVSTTVSAVQGVQASENLFTTVAAGGALTLTAGGDVDLGTPALDPTNTFLQTAAKDMNDATVTDTRSPDQGWVVSGQVANNFRSPANDEINSANLGWTPKVVSTSAGQTVTAGPAVAPANAIAASVASTDGLKSSRTLASANASGARGTAVLNASLVLKAPSNTPAGRYDTVLVLTAI